MTIIYKEENKHILRLLKGEELMTCLTEYVKKERISAGWFSVIGAGDNAEVSFYDLEQKKYLTKVFNTHFEIATITGNIAELEGETLLHAHGSFSKSDYSIFGGHVNSVSISGTGEIHLEVFNTILSRSFDQTTGLNLLDSKEFS